MGSSRDYTVIDGDGHVMEDDSVEEFIEAPFRGNRRLLGGVFPPGDTLHNEPVQMLPGARQHAGPKEWSAFLDRVGISTTVMYPSHALASNNATSRDWSIALSRAYNDWLHATYLQFDPRFTGMAVLPLLDVDAAVDELRRAVEVLGMKGAVLPSSGIRGTLGSKEYWPVYAEASRLGCALAVHGALHLGMGLEHMDSYPGIHAVAHPFGLMRAFASIVFNGVFDRCPGLRLGFLEGGVSWLSVCLERFDRSYETHVPFNPRGDVLTLASGQRVSDYIRALIDDHRLFVGCEGEEPAIAFAITQVGNRAFMYSSDFPHEVSVEMCERELDEIREHDGLSDDDRAAVLAGNARAFYRL